MRLMQKYCVICLALILYVNPAIAQTIPAFSGADGAAANVTGGRANVMGGIVYHVTKLDSAIDDPERNDFGTIRYGLNSANFPAGVPRTIVFDVGGVFNLGRLPQVGWDPNGNGWDAQSRLTIGGSNVTLAGQSAPGAGVIFMGGGLKPQGNNNMIRNITMASGYGMRNWWDPGEAYPVQPPPIPPSPGVGIFPDATVYDALDIAGTNLMFDHISTLYATDETISMNEVANNITVQYSNISQGQNYPQWDAEGGGYTGHALGSLLEAGSSTAQAAISFHHNLYAHQKARVPQTQAGGLGAYYDFRNNVFYNWFGTAGSKSGATFLNLVNNFYLAGDGGDQPVGGTNTGINQQGGGTGVLSASSSVYRNGNLLDSNKDADANDGVSLSAGGAANPLWKGGVVTYAGTTDTAAQAFDRVLDYMGANWWTRDGVIDTPDERIINEARTGTGKIMAWADDPWNNDPAEGAEWRALKNTPQTDRATDWDTEISVGYGVGDGMPSYWELQHGLDPNVRDNAGDFDSDGYTNLEEYLNDIAAWPAPAPIIFDGTTNSRYAQITNWDANINVTFDHPWQPSKYDEAQINNGTVVVDAVGQHAGTLVVAANAANMAQLDITGGWLNVADAVIVGGTATSVGTLNLSGGKLRTELLTKGAASSFNFTGGVLAADVVTFSVLNQGGQIAPGNSPGVTWVMGDLTMQSGSIEIEIAGNQAGEYDAILVDGLLTAGGTLEVLLDGYDPVDGDEFELFNFGSATGGFAFSFPSLSGNLAWDTADLLSTGVLSVVAVVTENADFDGDGDVDGRDFLTWQRGYGETGQENNLLGDANGDGTVDSTDLEVWQGQYSDGSPLVAESIAVPEPSAVVLWGLAAMIASYRRVPLACQCS